jgi:hypothetical protein
LILLAEVDIMNSVEKEGMKLYNSLSIITSQQAMNLARDLEDACDLI